MPLLVPHCPREKVCNLTFASKEARDGAVSTDMTDGMEYSYARLDDLFARKAA